MTVAVVSLLMYEMNHIVNKKSNDK